MVGADAGEGRARIVVAPGARAVEAALLEELEQLGDEARRDPACLAHPVWVVVPSRSLRDHLIERIAIRRGHAVAGVSVLTLRALAYEVVRRAAEAVGGGAETFAVVVRRLARQQPELRAVLDGFRDGYGVVAASVEDLLDAGFEPAHAAALDECLEAAGESARTARARALVRVAAAASEALATHGLEHRSGLVRRAERSLALDPGLLPARRVLVHGYADATGVQLELIATLVRCSDAVVFLDGSPGAAAYTARLRERLEGLAPSIELPGEPNATPELLRAPGAHAEVRAAAESIQTLLAAGAEPERIGVVVRDLGPYRTALRVQLRRLGIPFSGAWGRLGPATADGRGLRALVELVRARSDAPADLWLETLGELAAEPARGARGRSRLADLRVGLHVLGAGRLRDVAVLDPKRLLPAGDELPLPVRRGIDAPDDGGEDVPAFAPRRRLGGELLRDARERAASLVGRFEAWARAGDAAAHARHLRAMLVHDLAWDPGAPPTTVLLERLETLVAALPAGLPLGLDDFALLLARALEDLGRVPFGGLGSGVQVLDAMEARARTFEHLFVLGLGRGVFPRRVREDPLLPDSLRRRLLQVLPDVPVKARGYDEERYLFAQLCSASPRLRLSWQTQTDDGKERNASPFVEELRAELGGEVRLAPSLLAAAGATPPRPAFESALLAGIHRSRSAFRVPFEVALEEAVWERRPSALAVPAAALARARCAVLEEFDPSRVHSHGLGPFFGFVGPAGGGDPRRGPLYVTSLESLARCPWQTFLEKVLRLEPVPDALEALPEVDSLLLGSTVHAALEAIVSAASGAASGLSLQDLAARTPVDVPWPDAARLRSLLLDVARRQALEAGIALPGFAELLAERAQPFLERVRSLEAPDGWLRGVLGAEVSGEVLVETSGTVRSIGFRADRADADPKGLRLTDYKTGRLPAGLAREDHWPKKLHAALEGGLLLQAPAYAHAQGAAVAEGSYLFAAPGIDPALARHAVEPGDGEVAARFASTTGALVHAWSSGAFGPRLEDGSGKEPQQCERCPVSLACLRGDSTSRRRLARWLAEREAGEAGLEQALLGVLRLHGGAW